MKYILMLILIMTALQADKVKYKTYGCPTVVQLEKMPVDTADNYLDIQMYAIANNCVLLTKKSSIESVGYNANNSQDIYQEVIYRKTGVHLFVKRSMIIIEKFGRDATLRF